MCPMTERMRTTLLWLTVLAALAVGALVGARGSQTAPEVKYVPVPVRDTLSWNMNRWMLDR